MRSPEAGGRQREPGPGRGRDGVGADAVAGQLLRADLGERGDAGLGGAVVRLAGVGEQARRGRRVDDRGVDGLAGLGLLPPVGGRPAGGDEVALHVDLDDRVPLLLGHVDEHPVAQDAGVVDQHVEVAEGLDGAVDEALAALPVGDVVAVGDGLAAHGLDLLDDLLRGGQVGPGAVLGAAEVVDHDLGALRREQQRVLAADPAPGSGDDGDAAVKRSHGRRRLGRCRPAPPLTARRRRGRSGAPAGSGSVRSSGSGSAGDDVIWSPDVQLGAGGGVGGDHRPVGRAVGADHEAGRLRARRRRPPRTVPTTSGTGTGRRPSDTTTFTGAPLVPAPRPAGRCRPPGRRSRVSE